MTAPVGPSKVGLPDDPVLLAYEAEQAWEAYRNTLQTLQITQHLLEAREDSLGRRQPIMTSFERIASIVYDWQMKQYHGTEGAVEAMQAIAAEVERARQKSA